MIQIRNVPEDLHRRAKAKAAMEGVTLSDLALRALRKELRRLSVDEVVARVRELGQCTVPLQPPTSSVRIATPGDGLGCLSRGGVAAGERAR